MSNARWLMLPLCILLASVSFAQGYTLKVRLTNSEQYKLRLVYRIDNKLVIDSIPHLENGWFIFKGNVKEPVVANLLMPSNPALRINVPGGMIPGPYLEFVLSNDEIEITGDANTIFAADVRGGKANKEWEQIKAEDARLELESWLATKKTWEAGNADTALRNKAGRLYMERSVRKTALQKAFIRKNPNALLSLYFMNGLRNELSFEEMKMMYAGLGDTYKQHSYGKSISVMLENLEKTASGKMAVAINKKDINGNQVNLETLKGKYVLLDFWGSWCGPCRASHPHLKELYNKYKDKGFEIVGIAAEHGNTLEASRNSWKKAIQEDGLPWIQVLNNEDVSRFDAVSAYAVTAFPTKVLLDKDGRVIARYVGESKALDEKLKNYFGF